MLKPKRLIAYLIVAAMSMVGFTSCNDDDDPSNNRQYLMDMMTFLSTTSYSSTYSYQRGANSPEVILTANVGISSEVQPNSRVVAVFTAPGDTLPARNEDIQIYQLAKCYESPLKTVNIADSTNWQGRGLYVTSLWRTGNYLNLVCRVQQQAKDQTLGLWVDSTSLNTDCAEVYLVNTATADQWMATTEFYASFDIRSLVSQPGIKKIRVHVNNTNLNNKNEFPFPLDK